jgi:hypothetical protein
VKRITYATPAEYFPKEKFPPLLLCDKKKENENIFFVAFAREIRKISPMVLVISVRLSVTTSESRKGVL